MTHNAKHCGNKDGGGDDDHVDSDVCDGDGDVCRWGDIDAQRILPLMFHNFPLNHHNGARLHCITV